MKRSPGLSLHPRPQRPPAHSMQRKVHQSTAWHTSRSRCGPLPRTPGLPAALLADAICDHSRAATRPPGAPSARASSLCAARHIEPRDCTAPTRWPAPLDGDGRTCASRRSSMAHGSVTGCSPCNHWPHRHRTQLRKGKTHDHNAPRTQRRRLDLYQPMTPFFLGVLHRQRVDHRNHPDTGWFLRAN